MRSPTIILATLAAAVTVNAHGVMLTPTPRKTGAKQLAVCGSAVTAQLKSDTAGPIENSVAKIDANWTAACNLYLCRGYQYEDNKSNVKVYHPGDVQVIHIDLIAGHKPGWANVSVVDLATNKVIGAPLKSWSVWPDDVPGGGDDARSLQRAMWVESARFSGIGGPIATRKLTRAVWISM
ncbi:chitin binding protein [Rutstroemia sp. NJR-2017a WRK4]|nr:chitin binding protein [Rutstroemia sp. NJR-2017a WRK4]